MRLKQRNDGLNDQHAEPEVIGTMGRQGRPIALQKQGNDILRAAVLHPGEMASQTGIPDFRSHPAVAFQLLAQSRMGEGTAGWTVSVAK